MPFTYDPTMATERDQVRFLVQDTAEATAKFQDEEIDWLLTQEANVYTTAAALCDRLAVRVGNVKSKRISEFSIVYGADYYQRMGAELRARGAGHQIPYAGGISIADKRAHQADADATPASVTRRGLDNPSAPQPSTPPQNPLEQV